MGQAPRPENFRAEIARHRLTREAICERIGMHPNMLSDFVTGKRQLVGWAAHNIGVGINLAIGRAVIDVDMDEGVLQPPPPGRPPRWNRPADVDPLRRKVAG